MHLHVKDAGGADTLDGAALAVVLTAVREAAPGLPIGVTTGAWAAGDSNERVGLIRRWPVLPVFASVNWHEPGAEEVAGTLLARGVEVEAGLWHREAVEAWLGSPYRHRCCRVLLELPDGLDPAATAVEADLLLTAVAAGDDTVPVLLHGEGSSCWPALRHAVDRGLATRIGLEDTLELPDGSPAADNLALVQAALHLLRRDSPLR